MLVTALLAIATPHAARAQTAADSAGAMRAGLDYIEGFYEGDADKLRRSVRPDVAKYGLERARDATTYAPDVMTFDQFISYADRVKARGGKGAPANAPKEVKILDLLDQTAALKVTAWWGYDYLHLAKYDGKWMIAHVMWQSFPPRK